MKRCLSPLKVAAGRKFAKAFSLIEVTLAVGIASFSMLTVMGLLPVGLTIMRDAVDQTAESQIAQQLQGEILQTPFSQLGQRYRDKTYYFNEDGEPVKSATASRYQVLASLTDPVYPGSTNAPSGSVTLHIQNVQLDIVKTQGGTGTNRYNIQVPKSGD